MCSRKTHAHAQICMKDCTLTFNATGAPAVDKVVVGAVAPKLVHLASRVPFAYGTMKVAMNSVEYPICIGDPGTGLPAAPQKEIQIVQHAVKCSTHESSSCFRKKKKKYSIRIV